MSLLEALRFPLGKPARLLSFALVHTIVFLLFVEPMVYDERYPGSVPGVLLVSLFLIWLVFNAILLHGALVESFRRVTSGRPSLPRMSLSLLRFGGFRAFFAAVILFVYFIAFIVIMKTRPSALYAYVLTAEGLVLGEALYRLAQDVLNLLLAAIVSLMYFIGLARYALHCRLGLLAALKANLQLLLSNKRATIELAALQLVIMGIAALVFYLGDHIGYELKPPGLGYYPEDMRALYWSAVSMLAAMCGYLYFWYASAHLLAQFAMQVGLAPAGGYGTKKVTA